MTDAATTDARETISALIARTSMLPRPDIRNWYWIVGEQTDRVYSSKSNSYVPVDDPDYVAFLESGSKPSPIATEAEIWPCVSVFMDPALFNGTTFAQPAPDSYSKDQLLAHAHAKRWHKENGGTELDGMPISTDDRSKILIDGQRIAAEADSSWTTIWHGADGKLYPVNATKMIAISDALNAHVRACFTTYARLSDDIAAGKITTLKQIEAAFA
jgi:hypothetical protein